MNRTTVDNSDFLNQSSQSNRLLLLWQKIYLQKDESAFNFSQSMRGFMQQIDIAKRLHLLPSSAFDWLLFSYDKLYADVIDDKKTGLNNFSAEALSLAKLKSTEIDKWRSGLNLDAVPKTLLKGNKMDLNQSEASSFLKTLRNNWQTSKLDSCMVQSINDVGQTSKSASAVFNPVQAADATKNVQNTSLKRKCISPEVGETVPKRQDSCSFRTAKEQLMVNSVKSGNRTLSAAPVAPSSSGFSKKSLGPRRGNVTGRFIPPLLSRDKEENANLPGRNGDTLSVEEDDRLKNIDAKMIELITNEIMDNGPPVNWDDIAGLEFAKKTIKEIVVLPILRPDIFTGLRGPPKGLLLFGPPGTGKTLIGKCIASQSKSTFFSISASSLTSKWIGDGEKMVRALFAVARCHQPAVIFIDEIDSLLTQRSDSEHESSRRMKTEILIQLDGAATNSEDRILVVGATNRPQELDEAARRRLVKRLYIPLPELEARKQIVVSLLRHQSHSLTEENITDIGNRTAGYSGADMANLCKEAALGPIRCLSYEDIEKISPESVRPIIYNDFLEALHQVKASVSEADLANYLEWNLKFGSSSTNTTV